MAVDASGQSQPQMDDADGIFEKELVPNLKATRDSAEKQNGINLDGIKKCNTNNAETQQKIKSSTEA